MSNASATAFALVLAISAGACDRQPVSPNPQTMPDAPSAIQNLGRGSPRTVDELFVHLAQQVPGFGGVFFDENGYTVVNLVDPSRTLEAVVALVPLLKDRLVLMADGQVAHKTIKPRQADYDFAELDGWRQRVSNAIAGLPGVVFTDADEARNRVVIGVERDYPVAGELKARLAGLGVPREAVVTVETERFVPHGYTCPLGQVYPTPRCRWRPLPGGAQVWSEYHKGTCTLGFAARRPFDTKGYFVTASHCSTRTAEFDGYYSFLYQPNNAFTPDNRIGDEYLDPPPFTYINSSRCPQVNPSTGLGPMYCRWSDASLYKAEVPSVGGIAVDVGVILYPKYGSVEIAVNDPYRYVKEEMQFMYVGEYIEKVGRTTGRTGGKITTTCYDFYFPSETGNLAYICQATATYAAQAGDSGGPVFLRPPLSTGPYVTLYGIHIGIAGTDAVFSPITNVQLDLGDLLTIYGW